MAAGKDSYSVDSVSANSVTWCLSDQWDYQYTTVPWPLRTQQNGACAGCSCANWTMTLTPTDELQINYNTGSNHLVVALSRVGVAPAIIENMPGHGPEFNCNFTLPLPNVPPNIKKSKSRCPLLSRHLANSDEDTTVAASPLTDSIAKYEHCYILNRKKDFRLRWDLDRAAQMLHVQLSAKASSTVYYTPLSLYLPCLSTSPVSLLPLFGFGHLPFNLTLTHAHTLSLVLVVMMKSKELKTEIYSHAHSLILHLRCLSVSSTGLLPSSCPTVHPLAGFLTI